MRTRPQNTSVYGSLEPRTLEPSVPCSEHLYQVSSLIVVHGASAVHVVPGEPLRVLDTGSPAGEGSGALGLPTSREASRAVLVPGRRPPFSLGAPPRSHL